MRGRRSAVGRRPPAPVRTARGRGRFAPRAGPRRDEGARRATPPPARAPERELAEAERSVRGAGAMPEAYVRRVSARHGTLQNKDHHREPSRSACRAHEGTSLREAGQRRNLLDHDVAPDLERLSRTICAWATARASRGRRRPFSRRACAPPAALGPCRARRRRADRCAPFETRSQRHECRGALRSRRPRPTAFRPRARRRQPGPEVVGKVETSEARSTQDFKTCAVWQPHARSVRLRRRSVERFSAP